MASDVVVKNGDGEEVTHSDVAGVAFNTPDGGEAVFLNADDIPKELPEVTTEDDGKFLGVVGGVWQATDAPEGGDSLPEINEEYDNSKLLAVIDGKWQKANYENVIPKARLVPPMTSDYNGKVLGVRGISWEVFKLPLAWSRFEGVPFGELKTVFEERQITPTPTGEGSAIFQYITDEDVSEPVEGEAYKVKWGDSEYFCMARNMQKVFEDSGISGVVADVFYIGNLSVWLGEDFPDTGEPFLYLSRYTVYNSAFLTKDNADKITVSITPVNSFKKIPEEYLPDAGTALPEVTEADNGKVLGVVGGKWVPATTGGGTGGVVSWNDVTDKPFYEYTKEIQLSSVDTTVYFDALGTKMVWCTSEVFGKEESAAVVLNYEENGVGYSLSGSIAFTDDILLITLYGGIPIVIARQSGTFSVTALGEEFSLVVPQAGVYIACDETGALMLPVGVEGYSFWLSATVAKKIDDKFQHQPNWDETDNTQADYINNRPFGLIFADGEIVTDVTAPYSEGDRWFLLTDTSTGITPIDRSKVKEGALYSVTIGEHNFEGKGVSADYLLSILEQYVGNGIEIYQDGVAIAYFVTDWLFAGYSFISFVMADPTEELGLVGGTEYEIKIVTKESIKPLESKYIPAPPEFDLAAMGLPAIPADGTEVFVACDTTELCAALEKGAVKLIVKASTGAEFPEFPVSVIVNALKVEGYSCATVGVLEGIPIIMQVEVDSENIYGRVVPLVSALQ